MNYNQLLISILGAHEHTLHVAVQTVNRFLIIRNWVIGAYLVEFEQNGEDRAVYGQRLLDRISKDMAVKGIKGISVTSLRLCRQFFTIYPQIHQALPDELST